MVNEKRLQNILYELLKINSPSQKERSVSDYIKKYLSKLRIDTNVDDTSRKTGSDTGNLIAKIDGSIKKAPIMFSVHMDTIEATNGLKIMEKDGRIMSDGSTILGADDKAGLAIVIEMIEVLRESSEKHLPIEVVFSVSEEIGLVGVKALDFLDLESKIAFCFDGGGLPNKLITKSPTQETIEVSFTGKSAHAGVEPENGASAIFAAAKAAAGFPQGRLDEQTTANLGIISGGSATNVVAETAGYLAEVRGHDPLRIENAVRKIKEKAEKAAADTGTEVKVEQETSFVGFSLKEDEPVVEIAKKALARSNAEPVYAASGGGSDANIFNQKGIRTLTLSMGAQKAHSNDEFIEIEDFKKAAQLAVDLVRAASSA